MREELFAIPFTRVIALILYPALGGIRAPESYRHQRPNYNAREREQCTPMRHNAHISIQRGPRVWRICARCYCTITARVYYIYIIGAWLSMLLSSRGALLSDKAKNCRTSRQCASFKSSLRALVCEPEYSIRYNATSARVYVIYRSCCGCCCCCCSR